ncbi:glutathionylspermidine synthase family protein [Paenibacillus urinalis]|uniref:Glutathionylspermidine synthase family protein n=1 Tax=Paenibacillus urinalis TaxID=521520 RepID=A0ABY7XBW4_9BACL|nr:glutathionylspermidine synthase family protein [Paenibacillus urinalis]WDH98392.1 glutathionylspermidine synthase family protein [Paenibacillus urinalis]WDI02082.1 glutathionylspermidine synthase family protein [Paenibacillus urinalis]
MSKRHVMLIAATALALIAGGCASKPDGGGEWKTFEQDEQASLKVMYWDEQSFHEDYGNLFKSYYPNVEFEVIGLPVGSDPSLTVTELYNRHIEENRPDILFVDKHRWLESHTCGLQATSGKMRLHIAHAFRQLLEHYKSIGLGGRVVFTCYEWHVEDRRNTEYLMEIVQEMGYDACYVPLSELEIVRGEGLYSEGERIPVLYRLYPLEYLVNDESEDTEDRIGEWMLELVEEGKLGLINPAQSILTQSKGFMALIWSLYERHEEASDLLGEPLYTDQQLEAIQQYLLPTYYNPALFIQQGQAYVAKGYWGREGKGTSLFDEAGQLTEAEWGQSEEDSREDIQNYYGNQPLIYQLRCQMENVQVHTEDGPFSGYLLTGVYVIGGQYSGLLPRVGGRITGDMAYYCPAAFPIYMKEEH